MRILPDLAATCRRRPCRGELIDALTTDLRARQVTVSTTFGAAGQ